MSRRTGGRWGGRDRLDRGPLVRLYDALPPGEPVPCAGSHRVANWTAEDPRSRAALSAVAVCGTCPVLALCREYSATLDPHPPGVWAGVAYESRHEVLT